jgi:hypothetical protein
MCVELIVRAKARMTKLIAAASADSRRYFVIEPPANKEVPSIADNWLPVPGAAGFLHEEAGKSHGLAEAE